MSELILKFIESEKIAPLFDAMRPFFHFMTLASLYLLAISGFVSISAMAGTHLLILPSVIYFSLVFLRDGDLPYPRAGVALVALFSFGVISVFVNYPEMKDPFYSIRSLKYFLAGALSIIPYAYLLKDLKMNDKHLKRMINLFLFTVIAAHLSGFIAMKTGFNFFRQKTVTDTTRAMGLFGNIMTYGYETSWLVIFFSGVALLKNKLYQLANKPMFWSALVLSYIGLYLSYCRGALLATLIAIPLLFFFLRRRIFAISASLTGMAIVILVAASIMGGSGKSRFLMGMKSDSNMMRLSQFQAATMMFFEKPILGIGYREFANKSPEFKKDHNIKYSWFRSHTHNNYLEILTNAGLIAFVAFCFWIYFWAEDVYLFLGKEGRVVITILISFLISGFFQSTIIDGENMFFMMNLFAMSMALVMTRKKDSQFSPSKN